MNLLKNNVSESVILIVDDNLDNLKLLSDMLGKSGYKTRRAISGSLALQAIQATEFDLILLDITMPEMDGYQVCQKIKTSPKFAHIPIIFISALNDPLDKVKAFNVGGVDYVTKPFQIAEVSARINNQMRIVALQKELQHLNQKLEEKNQKLQLEQQDIRKSQARIVKNSLKDPITNLDTKIAFMGQLRQVIKTASENKLYNYALIIIQDQQFQLDKTILSIESANRCLIIISKQLRETAPNSSIVARLDDTEFGILITNITQQEDISKIGQYLQQKLTLSFPLDEQELFFNPNYGIALGNENYHNPEQLLYDARNAFNYALTKGYGYFQIFNQKIKQEIFKDLELKSSFNQAFKQQKFLINYQPIITLSTGKVSNFKTNIIWKYNNSIITLDALEKIANKINLLPELNHLLFKNICDRIRELQEFFMWQEGLDAEIDPNFKMIIPLSAERLLQVDFVEQFKAIMDKSHVEGEQIILELPTQVLFDQDDTIKQNINLIKQLSINFSIDRIGTDFLTFLEQQQLPIKNLIINSSLIHNLAENEVRQKIYGKFIAIARDLGISVIAEGITNPKQLEILKQYECEFGTGDYITQLVKAKLPLINQVI